MPNFYPSFYRGFYRNFYRCLLYLYPASYRQEFADEMVAVFRDAQGDVSRESFPRRIGFYVAEMGGLLAGAARERLGLISDVDVIFGKYRSISFTRFDMRPEFRFPRSTVVLMLIIFGGVVLIMKNANTIMVAYGDAGGSIWPSLPWFLGFAFLVAGVAAIAAQGIRFVLRKTGAHRLESLGLESLKTGRGRE